MNKKAIEDSNASLEYFNSDEYKGPDEEEIVECSICGEKKSYKDMLIKYIISPISLLFLPPSHRKYWCNRCFK